VKVDVITEEILMTVNKYKYYNYYCNYLHLRALAHAHANGLHGCAQVIVFIGK
jgi:hypothetical protein